ncbi:hypothetical protein D3C86_1473630 [compost metagenome]
MIRSLTSFPGKTVVQGFVFSCKTIKIIPIIRQVVLCAPNSVVNIPRLTVKDLWKEMLPDRSIHAEKVTELPNSLLLRPMFQRVFPFLHPMCIPVREEFRLGWKPAYHPIPREKTSLFRTKHRSITTPG